jgi:hypothetical protein
MTDTTDDTVNEAWLRDAPTLLWATRGMAEADLAEELRDGPLDFFKLPPNLLMLVRSAIMAGAAAEKTVLAETGWLATEPPQPVSTNEHIVAIAEMAETVLTLWEVTYFGHPLSTDVNTDLSRAYEEGGVEALRAAADGRVSAARRTAHRVMDQEDPEDRKPMF